jgi:cold shock CspA family protein
VDDGRSHGRCVKWFSVKGYGFLQPDGGGGPDIFCHIESVENRGSDDGVEIGGRATFVIGRDPKDGGLQATRVWLEQGVDDVQAHGRCNGSTSSRRLGA